MDDYDDMNLVSGDTPVKLLDDNTDEKVIGSFVVVSSEKDTEVEDDIGFVCGDKDSEAGEDNCFDCGDKDTEVEEDNGLVRMSRLGSEMGSGGTEWDGEIEDFILLMLDVEKEEGLALNWKEISASLFCGGSLEGKGD